MNNSDNEIPKYKKKSNKKPPKKHDHKHEFHDCVYEFDIPCGSFSREKGFVPKHVIVGGSYCSICGRVDNNISFPWWQDVHTDIYIGNSCVMDKELTDRAIQEINLKSRTLPTFYIEDDLWRTKYVDLKELEK